MLSASIYHIDVDVNGTYSFDTVGILGGEFRIVRGLDGFVDDAVDDTQGLEVEGDTIYFTRFDFLVLFAEVVEELLVRWVRLLFRVELTAGP